ncbi:substrate-binding domain-containing protein [cyanobacterium endosymbiont of Epithemia clementina EcSB]|uniref:substrate-binding domain-containing protein n=1 Tax=cyanobacterium endosymbiont of Epithemia clementina EcSB TaxID=3034674 RepID=UPI00248066BC|nr:substrate-binding domain-containing protein [cyanobacterium endosymbiont of Epithemia clementina EcSB]WGT66679.1 substrate-binding domain-containing protein [cyanobacterium endosymbiont of Epithemia clementina EcSB]
MSQKNKTYVIIMFLLITAGILGGAYWWFIQKISENHRFFSSGMTIFPKNKVITSGSPLPPPPSPTDSGTFFFPTKIPPGILIRISSSTTMELLNQALKNGFEQQFPEAQIIVNTQKSDKSIELLLRGNVDIAAISRDLTNDEKSQGLTAILMAKDVIAIVIGAQNPFRHGLTQTQVVDIFQGKITNWSILGRSPGAIQVINHPSVSSTRQIFEQLILKRKDFGNTSDIITTTKEVTTSTTSILRALGTDGISYATYSQIGNQQIVRTVPIDDHTSEVSKYPYRQSLYYVYQKPSSEAVKTFLGYAVSPMGQQIINDTQ